MINWIIGIILLAIIILALRHVRAKGTCDCGCGDSPGCKSCHEFHNEKN